MIIGMVIILQFIGIPDVFAHSWHDKLCLVGEQSSPVVYSQVSNRHLDSLEIRSLYVDRNGALWVGTKNQGVYKQHQGKTFRVGSDVGFLLGAISLLERGDGALWISGRGLWRIHESQIHSYKEDDIGNRVVFSISASRNGEILASGNAGVTFLSGLAVAQRIGTSEGLEHPVVHDTYESPDGALWMATRKVGLKKWSQGKWDSFLPEINCRKLLSRDNNQLLVGTSNGLVAFDMLTNESRWIIEPGFPVLPMLRVGNETWCVGEGNGLWKFNGDEIQKTEVPGNPTVYAIVLLKNKLVIGTERGLIRMARI